MIFPGIAPMYVRLCPLISASSRIPPTEKRKNFLPSARAIERPTEVLPTPGGPTKHTIEPAGALSSESPPLRARSPVVERSFSTARYSAMRFFTSFSP